MLVLAQVRSIHRLFHNRVILQRGVGYGWLLLPPARGVLRAARGHVLQSLRIFHRAKMEFEGLLFLPCAETGFQAVDAANNYVFEPRIFVGFPSIERINHWNDVFAVLLLCLFL